MERLYSDIDEPCPIHGFEGCECPVDFFDYAEEQEEFRWGNQTDLDDFESLDEFESPPDRDYWHSREFSSHVHTSVGQWRPVRSHPSSLAMKRSDSNTGRDQVSNSKSSNWTAAGTQWGRFLNSPLGNSWILLWRLVGALIVGTLLTVFASTSAGGSEDRFMLLWLVVFPFLCVVIAWKKQRSLIRWGLIGLITGSFGVAWLLVMPASRAKTRRSG